MQIAAQFRYFAFGRYRTSMYYIYNTVVQRRPPVSPGCRPASRDRPHKPQIRLGVPKFFSRLFATGNTRISSRLVPGPGDVSRVRRNRLILCASAYPTSWRFYRDCSFTTCSPFPSMSIDLSLSCIRFLLSHLPTYRRRKDRRQSQRLRSSLLSPPSLQAPTFCRLIQQSTPLIYTRLDSHR